MFRRSAVPVRQMHDDAQTRVLVVEDHHLVGEMLVDAMSREPELDVVGLARSVAEARVAAAEQQPEVILMDYRLPDGTGAEAARAISAAVPGAKVLMLTSAEDDTILVDALESGCAGFITKYRSVREVVSAIEAIRKGDTVFPADMLARILPRMRGQRPDLGADLTPREVEVLRLLAQGLSNSAIAATLDIRLNTVRNHVQNLLTKLNAHSKLEAVAAAARAGLIEVG